MPSGSISEPGALFFAASGARCPAGASAIATATPQVAFSVGSRLASLKGGIANALLNKLLGTNVELAWPTIMAWPMPGSMPLPFSMPWRSNWASPPAPMTISWRPGRSRPDRQGAGGYPQRQPARGRPKDRQCRRRQWRGAVRKLSIWAIWAGFRLAAAGKICLRMCRHWNCFRSAPASATAPQAALDLRAGLPGWWASSRLAVGEPPQGGSWFAIGPDQTVARTAQVRLRLVAKL